MSLERVAKTSVVASAVAALLFEAYLGGREWSSLVPVTLVVLVGAFAVGRYSTGASSWIALLSAYIFPILFQIVLGRFQNSYHVVWMATLLGAVVARMSLTSWAFPPRWKIPLVYWALVVSVSWPLVIMREADFSWAAMTTNHLANSGLGGPPSVEAVWICNVALTHMLGLLWFDWCFGVIGMANGERFKRVVIAPLAVSVAIGCALAVYQSVVDINYLNDHQWPILHRAAGGLLDGDAFGALAGLWTAAFVALAGTGGWVIGLAGIGGAVAAWGGAWATGSRMAVFGGLIGLVFAAFGGAVWVVRRRSFKSVGVIVMAAAVAVVLGFGLLRLPTTKRLHDTVKALPKSWSEVRPYAKDQLFDRGSPFGSASVLMMKDSPAVGIGVGGFHEMFPDYSFLIVRMYHGFDNAQSWYRHQLAELGVVGSLGWIAWVAMFVWLLMTTRADPHLRFSGTVVKGALVAVGVVSQVSMPTQSTPVSLTVWVLAFWYLTMSSTAQARLAGGAPSRTGWPWVGVWMLVICFGAGTLWMGVKYLRPPHRAVMAEWDYERGLEDVERSPAGERFRWTGPEAVAVVGVPERDRYLKLTFWVSHPDIVERPVDVEIRRSGKRIGRITLSNSTPVTWYVKAPAGPRMMLEMFVSRTWRPADYGSADPRTLGLALADWAWVSVPPRGALQIE